MAEAQAKDRGIAKCSAMPYNKIPSLTVYERKNGYTLDFMRSVAIFPFVTICAIFSLIPVLTVLFL